MKIKPTKVYSFIYLNNKHESCLCEDIPLQRIRKHYKHNKNSIKLHIYRVT